MKIDRLPPQLPKTSFLPLCELYFFLYQYCFELVRNIGMKLVPFIHGVPYMFTPYFFFLIPILPSSLFLGCFSYYISGRVNMPMKFERGLVLKASLVYCLFIIFSYHSWVQQSPALSLGV